MAGFSENLSSVYFVSTEKLTGSQQNSEGAEAAAGAQNLYLRKAGGGFVFIARVLGNPNLAEIKPSLRRSRVSPDGLHLAFSTASRLTEYDNTDVLTGTLDSEVYLYDAEVGPVGTLRCVGCNPSGARPHGTLGTASTIPGWFEQLHPSRLLSADGNRLFFNSFDGLVPRDQNTAMDVYLWQRASGQADCQTLGAEYFAADSGGCLSMISGGQGPQNAEVLDASVDGRDLFFTTGVSLLPQDPAQVDVYDARIGGGFPQPEVLSICNVDADNCRPPTQGPSSPSPASNAKGSGNPPAKTKPKKCPKGKHRVTKKGKSRCVPNKKKAKKGKAANKSGRARDEEPRQEPCRSEPADPRPRGSRPGRLRAQRIQLGLHQPRQIPGAESRDPSLRSDDLAVLRHGPLPQPGPARSARRRVKDVTVSLPPGFVGDPTAVTTCSSVAFSEVPPKCPASSQVGTVEAFARARASCSNSPLQHRAAARPGPNIGFQFVKVPVTVDFRVNPDPPFNVPAPLTTPPTRCRSMARG